MGEVFAGRYELLEPVAEGGMGSVWTVRDHSDGSVKAAKLLRHSDASALLRFMREQSTRIHHPHVVTPQSWAGQDDTVLFTMPLVTGGSVATLVGDWGPLPQPWVVAVLDQTLAALEAVHAAGIVHRDVKPANLLLEPTGDARPHVRLTDFGIAAAHDQPRLTEAASAVGTRGYAAPEQLAGAHPDPRQDLYALAVVGIEMLVGHPPPFAPEELPTGPLAALLTSVMDPEPARRPASAAQLRAMLHTAAPAGPWEPGEVEVLEHLDGTGAPTTTPRAARTRIRSIDHPGTGPGSTGVTAPDGGGPAPRRTTSPAEPAEPVRPNGPASLAAPAALALLGLALLLVAVVLLLPR